MQKGVTIIIPTFNNTEGLRKLLSIFTKIEFPIVVVDNKPNEEKKDLSNKQVTYLPQQKNLGFAAAINLGAKDTDTDWILILNDDIEFSEPAKLLINLTNYAEKNNLIAVSPVLVNNQGKVENYGYRVLPYGKVDLATDNVKPIDGLTAACLLFKTEAFQKLNGFNESFFAYLEDVDLFLRVKKQFGNDTFAIAPDIQVTHLFNTTSKTMGYFKQKQDLINWIRLIIKHPDHFLILPIIKFNLSNFIKLLIERLRNFYGLIKAITN